VKCGVSDIFILLILGDECGTDQIGVDQESGRLRMVSMIVGFRMHDKE